MNLFYRLVRLIQKPPSYIFQRLITEIGHELDRFTQPKFGKNFSINELLKSLGDKDIEACWTRILSSPVPFYLPSGFSWEDYPDDNSKEHILSLANMAGNHEIDLLGSGQISLGQRINWSQDYKTGDSWPLGYFRSIDYINQGRSSDVKTVWELSRMQWLIPCGQAYLLTGEERYAEIAREVIDSWILANPYAMSVNWGVTMEPAMRILVWSWLFYACGRSKSWTDEGFRAKFLSSMFLHATFAERFIERGDINGNHFTADASALVVAGTFFGRGQDANRWLCNGIAELEQEMPRQVSVEGVNFEASVAYHRLVAELFLIAAAYARTAGHEMSKEFKHRLAAMGHFTAAYVRKDGSSPLWGDADDARSIPFGPEHVMDHRYLPGLIGLFLDDMELIDAISAPPIEAWWWFGPEGAKRLPGTQGFLEKSPRSIAFEKSGYFILRDERVHAFIDAAPIGLAGRGGHGHNDILSFELAIDGVTLVSDAGSFVYTADFKERNAFRSGYAHNTPMIDGQEQNRFYGPEMLWTLQYDAKPEVRLVDLGQDTEQIVASHTGYRRLTPPVIPVRTFKLLRGSGKFIVMDKFEGETNSHDIRIPLLLAPKVEIVDLCDDCINLRVADQFFRIKWSAAGVWSLNLESGWVSRSYGVRCEANRLVWTAKGENLELNLEFQGGVSMDYEAHK